MPNDKYSSFIPRAPRFRVADSSDVRVTVTRTEESDTPTLHAELVDVSQHGAKLRVPVNLRFEEALQLKIEVLNSDLEYHGIASVRHIRALADQNDQDHWLVGCAIAPALNDETFSYLATNSGAERRRFRRLPVAAEVTVRRQAQTEGTPATLHNLSSGGFCFSSVLHCEVDERVQLSIEDREGLTRTVEARICWQVENSENTIAGCEFSDSTSYAELCACLTEQPALQAAGLQDAPTSKLVLSAAILAMFLPPVMTLLLQAKKVSAEAVVEQHAQIAVKSESKNPHPRSASQRKALLAPTSLPAEIAETDPQEPTPREWVDNTGKHRTLAELVEVTDEHVVLKKETGKQIIVPWRRLSEADQAFAREWKNEP